MAFPNGLRIILLFLSLTSFIPQYSRIFARQDSGGIAINTILYHLIVATQQFSYYLLYCIISYEAEPSIVVSPLSVANLLDLAQFGLVWLCQLVLFIICLYYRNTQDCRKPIAGFIAFLSISLILVLWISTIPGPNTGDAFNSQIWIAFWYHVIHTYYINFVVTVFAFLAFVPQARKLRNDSDLGALSLAGLLIQAIVFALVTVSWYFRLHPDAENPRPSLWFWYIVWGWATVDNGAFAIVQFLLWIIALRRSVESSELGETTPLLR